MVSTFISTDENVWFLQHVTDTYLRFLSTPNKLYSTVCMSKINVILIPKEEYCVILKIWKIYYEYVSKTISQTSATKLKF